MKRGMDEIGANSAQQEHDIEALASLRKELTILGRDFVATMNYYASTSEAGFWHQPSKTWKASLSTTATCVSALIRAGQWDAEGKKWNDPESIAERLLRKEWTSADLPDNNPFSLSFIAEGVLDVTEASEYPKAEVHKRLIYEEVAPLLMQHVVSHGAPFHVPGSVSIAPYPPSAYLTQLAFRALRRCFPANEHAFASMTAAVREWARSEVRRQMVLISTKSRIADPMQLAYAVIVARSAVSDDLLSPEEKSLFRSALQLFFATQLDDGSWPSSQPLFHYPKIGNAQCFEYELLTQLLLCEPLQEELHSYIGQFEKAVLRLRQTSFLLKRETDSSAVGWASGHHPQNEGPESWATACVYDFLHALGRLVAEAVRQSLFKELNNEYRPPVPGMKSGIADFAPRFLDADLRVAGSPRSLREALFARLVHPIELERETVRRGGSLPEDTPMSAILFGPPGTSKTKLAEAIADYLGWPQLSVDPSYLVQDGMERLYARANKLFSMLAMAEQVVVLLDEFDEMGRDRTKSDEVLSRFITTAMLPKLAAINNSRKIVFLLATNYVSDFDAAFSRGGRFDRSFQVMPPTFAAKVAFKNKAGVEVWRSTLETVLAGAAADRPIFEAQVADLTFLETKDLISALKLLPADPLETIRHAWEKCTLNRMNGEVSWKVTSEKDETAIRI